MLFRSCLHLYRRACASAARPPDWRLVRFAWVAADGRRVREEVLPEYVGGLMEHWRESVEDPVELDLFARLDAGESIGPEAIAQDRLLWGTPDDVISQIQRYRDQTGCTSLHAAFGAGLPSGSSNVSSMGDFDEIAAMIRLFGREVIPAFPGEA